jgi:queuosine precursor transporter
VTNGLIFAVTVLISLFFILLMLRLGKQGLAGFIVTNIILVSCFGSLLIPLFGLTTNAGNVFYASIFLAAQVMTEHFGRRAALRSVWTGFGALVLFVLLAQYSIRLSGGQDTDVLVSSLENVFIGLPRLALASMLAYLVSQNLNVWLFDALSSVTGKKKLWLRSLLAAAIGQLVDSVLFFSIAFAHTLSNGQLFQAMIAGFCIKMVVTILGIGVLYASYPVVQIAGRGIRDQSGAKD